EINLRNHSSLHKLFYSLELGDTMHTIFSKIDKKYKIEYWLLLGMNIISTGILTFNVYLEGILLNSLVYKADRAAFVRSIVLITTLSLIRLLLSYFMNKIQILRFREINMEVNDVIMKELYVKDTLAVTKMNSVQTADKITEDTTEVLTFLFQTINQIISIALSSILIFTYLFMAGSGFLLLIAILLPAYSLIYLFLRSKIFEVSLKLKEAYNEYFSGFTEWLSRYIEIKGNRREKIETERWSNTKRTLLGVAKRDFLLNLMKMPGNPRILMRGWIGPS
ncbi:MAG: ABC transporter transmembrane domain-containing protein, partial [Lactobacillus crispatus]|nr:ABC transporter transmembrane domain-containing protein [Lactobacillus crispatus]